MVNEDGDKGGKREYCAKLGLEYLVLKRTPAPGLPLPSSTHLRRFLSECQSRWLGRAHWGIFQVGE